MTKRGGSRPGAGRPITGKAKRITISGSIDPASVMTLRQIMVDHALNQSQALDLVIQSFGKAANRRSKTVSTSSTSTDDLPAQ